MPSFHIAPDIFLEFLVDNGKKVLYDGLLVEMLYAAKTGLDNGISTWWSERDTCVVSDVLQYYDQDRSSTLVLVLSPGGVMLTPPSSYERREPDDIWVAWLIFFHNAVVVGK